VAVEKPHFRTKRVTSDTDKRRSDREKSPESQGVLEELAKNNEGPLLCEIDSTKLAQERRRGPTQNKVKPICYTPVHRGERCEKEGYDFQRRELNAMRILRTGAGRSGGEF